MYCPQCKAEFRDGFAKCPDCGVDLIPELTLEPPDSQSDLAMVLESSDAFTVGLAKGTLEDAHILFLMQGDEPGSRIVLWGLPFAFPTCRFWVHKHRASEARDLLAEVGVLPGAVQSGYTADDSSAEP